jgi:hypothetical protein
MAVVIGSRIRLSKSPPLAPMISAALQHALDLDSHLVDVQALADRIGIAEQIPFHRASDHAHPSHRRDIFVGDPLALGRVPVPSLVPLGFDAPHDGLDLVAEP